MSRIRTPWGDADDNGTQLAEGITLFSTPSHGGIRLSEERIAQLPKGMGLQDSNFLKSLKWWEEDCDAIVPVILFREDIENSSTFNAGLDFESLERTLAHTHPNLDINKIKELMKESKNG